MADYYAALVSLTAEVARTYVVIRTFEVLIEQAREERASSRRKRCRSRSRASSNGATSELDATQATTLLESTRATIPQLQIGLRAGAQRPRARCSASRPAPSRRCSAGPKAIPEGAREGRRSACRPRCCGGARTSAAPSCRPPRSARASASPRPSSIPSFSLFGIDRARGDSSGAGSTRTSSRPTASFYSVGPRINWPFFNYGRLTNGVRVEDARFQQLLVDYRDTVLKAAQEVEDALAGFLNAQEAAAFEQAAVTAAQRSVEIALVQYREGAADYQRVLDAQRSLLQQQNNLAQTRSSVATNLIALYKALGGGWEVAPGPAGRAGADADAR